MHNKLTILALCGSLRKDSYNMMILKAAQKVAPENVVIEIAEIGDLPIFNQDLEVDPPSSVIRFREKVKNSGALLFASPEHNYSVTAALKNALEWGSRPYGSSVMSGKPAAIMGASTGMLGTGRSQYHLRQICVQINLFVLNRPEVMISFAEEKFDSKGNCIDEKTIVKIKKLIEALVLWIDKLS